MSVLMPFKNQSAAKLFANNLAGKGGHYLLGANSHWHGGMHFSINAPVQAIANGKLIAFRIAKEYCETELRFSRNNTQNQYSNSFALIKHECTIKERTLNYYSLYMHLQPASEYAKDKSQIIPDYLRVLEGRPRDAVIDEDEDKPSGLNIRNCKTGNIVTTAPITSLLDLDSSATDPLEDAKFLTKQASNIDYKKVSFTDYKDVTHMGYALLDEERTKAIGNQYQVITNEDPLTGSAKSDLAGLNLRSAMNGLDETILKILKKGTPVKLELQDSQWSKVIEIDGKKPEETCYLYHLGKVKFDENDIDEGLLDAIHCPNQDIEAGAFIGLPGQNFDQKHCLHFEIFTDDSIKEFIKPHDNLPESDLTILQVKQGSTLFKREKIIVRKERDASIAKLSRIKTESDGSDSEYVKVTTTDIGLIIKWEHLGEYEGSTGKYAGVKLFLEEYQKRIPSLTATSELEFISYSTSEGIKCSEAESDKFRLTSLPLPSGEQKSYWVKRGDIDTQKFGSKGSFLTNNITEVYLEKPDDYSFTEESSQGCSDDCYIDLTESEQYKDSDGKKWFKVTLPFDDNGLQHYFYAFLGVNRENQKVGWVKAEDTELTSPLNWPGFTLVHEENEGPADARIDFNNCNSFFTELFNDIDLNKDGKIIPSEMRAALKNDSLAERLSRVIAKHPSEWQNDEQCSKWDHLKEYVPDDAAFKETKKQITELSWWDKAKSAGAELPDSPEIHHLHPLSSIKQIDLIGKRLITLEMLKTAAPATSTDYLKGILEDINHYAQLYKVNTKLRICHFLSQVGHESGFKAISEKLGYSKNQMQKTYGCKSGKWIGGDIGCAIEDRITKNGRENLFLDPDSYEFKPEPLANLVYGNREGNAAEDSGDGYKYRGRGLIQLTFKNNYKAYTKLHNELNPDDPRDFVVNPDLILTTPRYAVESAFAWWSNNNVNNLCLSHEEPTIIKVTKKVNGGDHGLEKRSSIFNSLWSMQD